MKTFYKPPHAYSCKYGEVYACNHPYYNRCTLFKMNNKGIAVVQQRFNPRYKWTWWGPIDPWLNDEIYENSSFSHFFAQNAQPADLDGLYPTFTVRKLMWALRMPPMKKEVWETRF